MPQGPPLYPSRARVGLAVVDPCHDVDPGRFALEPRPSHHNSHAAFMHISNAVTFQRVSRSPCQHVELTWNVFSGHGVVHHNQMYVLTLCASAAQVGRSQVILIGAPQHPWAVDCSLLFYMWVNIRSMLLKMFGAYQ